VARGRCLLHSVCIFIHRQDSKFIRLWQNSRLHILCRTCRSVPRRSPHTFHREFSYFVLRQDGAGAGGPAHPQQQRRALARARVAPVRSGTR
jgi:hypothetical protein